MKNYNEFRPHGALWNLSPIACLESMKNLTEIKEAILPKCLKGPNPKWGFDI